jgi:hypothetical protein
MNPSLVITKIWEDDDMIEVTLAVSDGKSLFSTEIYVGHKLLEDTIGELDRFKTHVHGGLYDIEFGTFGPEFASGAARIRMHFHHMARICVSAFTESEFKDFSIKNVASRGEIYFYSEPALLDNFISELTSMSKHQSGSATLLCRI